MEKLISKEQGGYIVGHQNMAGIIVAHKTIHSMKNNKKLGMLMKLDMSKAYDRLNWYFITGTLEAFGFFSNWIRWILNLVRLAFFSILVNGALSQPFSPARAFAKEILYPPLFSF